MQPHQFKSKCCEARVYRDNSEKEVVWRCSNCDKIVEEVTIPRRQK